MYGDERGFGDPLFSQNALLQTDGGSPGGPTGIRLYKATVLMIEADMKRPPRPHGYTGDADIISRVLWSTTLSDNRVPATGALFQSPDWPNEDLVHSLQEFHGPTDAPELINTRIEGQPISFRTFLSILSESYRILSITNEKGLILRIADELEKQLSIAESSLAPNTPEDDAQPERRRKLFERQRSVARDYVKGVEQLCLFHPEARAALGLREGKEGAFFILRYMVCMFAIKSVRSLYRQPPTSDCFGLRPWTKTRNELLSHLEYFCTMQIACDAEFKARGCAGLFGGGRGEMNMSYVHSQRPDWNAQNACLHRAIALADESGDDFVSCVSRYRMCMGIMYGGRSYQSRPGFEGIDLHVDTIFGADGSSIPAYYVGDIATLCEEAAVFERRLESIGHLHIIEGETGQRHCVLDCLTDWKKSPYFPELSQPLQTDWKPDDGYKTPPSSSATSSAGGAAVGGGGNITVSTRGSKSHCTTCGRRAAKDAKLMCCSRCHGAYYCDAECQKKHWKEHKHTCVASPKT